MSVSLEDMITLKRVGFLADEVYSVRGFPSHAARSFMSCTYRSAPVSMSMTSSKQWCVLRLYLSLKDLKAKSRRPSMLTEIFLSINSPIYSILLIIILKSKLTGFVRKEKENTKPCQFRFQK